MLQTTSRLTPDLNPKRIRVQVQGVVQGVGFRPFIYHLATTLGLTGWVNNSPQGVSIELEGQLTQLEAFLEQLQRDNPLHANLQSLTVDWLTAIGYQQFEIRPSETTNSIGKSACILPDLATCPDCRRELFDPANRRYRYPFTNCTHCGPRFSILRSLPYDRPNTTMHQFQMCPDCQLEYDNPGDRRFHAQPNACPHCGPQLTLWNRNGDILATHDTALLLTADAIRQGKIIALKGLGGFHLVVDARNEIAVQALRQHKHRPDKPLAVMYPDLESLQQHCYLSTVAIQLLQSPEAPIVLLPQIACDEPSVAAIAPSVAPGNPDLGVMLPYTPLHHLLLAELGFPVVATSGNLANEPICIDQQIALQQLGSIADLFLIHDRPIARPVDDSIVRVIHDRPVVLRRARGYAPLPLKVTVAKSLTSAATILAVGGQLKNTVALGLNQQIFLSQHLGDLDHPATIARFQEAIAHLLGLYETQPTAIACDAHPDYYSHQFAASLSQATNATLIPIQHHYAHVLSCLADNQIDAPVLGVAWDGTGYGLDGTIWGGEWLYVPTNSTVAPGFERIAHLRPFPLPGGDQAVKEPRRAALGLLYECLGSAIFDQLDLPPFAAFTPSELKVLQSMLGQRLNTPMTSSMGRLFDAIAAIIHLCHQASFEGQAAMQLEFAAQPIITDRLYPYTWLAQPNSTLILDWQPLVLAIIQDWFDRESVSLIAATFHNTVIDALVTLAQHMQIDHIALTGGCFQNSNLLKRSIDRLNRAGFSPIWHHHIPTNDGGIAAGQALGALRQLHYKTI
ncbi:carbamoyltransferase HypF [Pantanalinema sp. GBBB05]|uniref:carbamoyltransferase HypF n=1 Tax=Pantanalinema sp. GBBB05 TaxID=2604139 RepID=UPI001D5E9F3A|nr:carbamoyltransferase HypF [Pantanalinema sp. GBBB05]